MSFQVKAETNIFVLIVATLIMVSIGGLVQITPLFFQHSTTEPIKGLKPYSALRLTGRDIYIREGCNTCHSQMIRPFRAETDRYGHYSVAGEFVYDKPFLWGSKRTGPDLHRVGGRYSDDWHRVHLENPRNVVPESVMPAYPWLLKSAADSGIVQAKMRGLRMVGIPYTDEDIDNALDNMLAESGKASLEEISEMDAVIAYLQGLGIELKRAR
jgi:cytochrome c oxidase cbb3-type subunit 2